MPWSFVAFAALALVPAAANGQWTAKAHYPRKALREGREGTTYLTVTVGTNGRAKNCVVTRSSGSADLDEAACKMVVKNARFQPETDENGKPKEAPYSTRVDWRIPY
jgi:protein TonB